MLKNVVVLSALVFSTLLAIADNPLIGVWSLSSTTQKQFSPACQNMLLQIKDNNEIVRTSGRLVYSSSAVITASGAGYLLTESLNNSNGERACSGIESSQVVQHLSFPSYVEIVGNELHYYRIKGDKHFIGFVKSGT